MSNAISRESFQELKNYLGVHFQQGRPILDADLNEAQAVLRSMVRRFTHDLAGDGSPNHGFAIEQLVPPHRRPTALDQRTKDPQEYTAESIDYLLQYLFEPQGLFLTVPGDDLLDGFGSGEFTASQGRVRVSHDRPYGGDGFLRVSGHTGPVTVSRRLKSLENLSEFDVATFRYRLNRPVSGIIRFFLEDDDGNRTVWPCQTPLTFPADTWLAGVAAPLADATFYILARWLPLARVGRSYQVNIDAYGGTAPVTWTLSGDDLPPGITLTGQDSVESFHYASLGFKPAATGTFTVDITVADAEGRSTTRSLPLTVVADDGLQYSEHDPNHSLSQGDNMIATATSQRAVTDLTAIRLYGFELYQADEPLVWDLDDLRLGDPDQQTGYGKNNFVIRGSEVTKNVRRTALVAMLRDENGDYLNLGEIIYQYVVPRSLHERLDSELMRAAEAADDTGRFYLAGLPCVLADDILYSDQADPNDPPLAPPPAGQVRRDVVYLDAWTEPVTYVQDPAIREVALGGPDTSTRERVRHRVRVAQGGRTPTGDGMGFGTLATEGAYTAAANRLYRVEIDGPGDIGAATFRWSHENASVIARVIEPLAPGSTVVTVEDASAFHPGDLVLLRKEFGAERHEVSQVTGNEITLAAPTGDQLAQLPAAGTPDFTTFSLADRPMVQRWHGFGVAIPADPDDATVSASLPLDDGVRIRFGGHSMLAGDFWTFTTRYLPGDEPAGFDADTRVEPLGFARPQGVRHHFAPLAEFTRHGDAPDDAMITDIEDRRARLGGSTRTFELASVAVVNDFATYIGGVRLSASTRRGEHLVILSGTIKGPGEAALTGSFYTDEMTDPEASPATGLLLSRVSNLVVQGTPTRITLVYTSSGPDFDRAPSAAVPTSLQFFVRFASGTSFDLGDLTATVIEPN